MKMSKQFWIGLGIGVPVGFVSFLVTYYGYCWYIVTSGSM